MKTELPKGRTANSLRQMILGRQKAIERLMKTPTRTAEEAYERNRAVTAIEHEIWDFMDQLELYEAAEREDNNDRNN